MAKTLQKSLRLADVLEQFDQRLGKEPEPEILTLTEKHGFVSQRERFSKRLAIEDTSNYKLIGINDIAFNPYLLWAGAVAQNTSWKAAIISPLYPTFRVRKGYDARFVNHLLCGGFLLPEYDSISFGSVPRKRRSSVEDFLAISIPVQPSLAEQTRIVKLLDEADALRKLRAQADTRTAELIPALFDEMFGNPETNPKKWPKKELRELGRVVTGTTPPSAKEGMFGGEIPFLTPGDLERDTESPVRYVTQDGAANSRTVRAGSTLVCCIGATIGKTDRTWKLSAFNQQINAIEWEKEISDEYGFVCMKLSSNIVIAGGSQTALPIIKKSLFEKITVPVPPLPLQKEFAACVAAIRELGNQQSASRSRLEALFQSMLHKAFRGEL